MDPEGSILCSQFSTSDHYPVTDSFKSYYRYKINLRTRKSQFSNPAFTRASITSIKADEPETRDTDIKTANEMHTTTYVGTFPTNSHIFWVCNQSSVVGV
jgi:hypothetical protein